MPSENQLDKRFSINLEQAFDSQVLLSYFEDIESQTTQEIHNSLVKVVHIIKNTNTITIQKEFSQNQTLLNELIAKIKLIFSYQDPQYESCILLATELLQKITASCYEQLRHLYEQYLLQWIVINTAHPKQTVRKSSRSCIANYVRYYKDLNPILKSFRVFGIQNNENQYQKQCIILILPNLINLDSSVISEKCTEFLLLLDSILLEIINNIQQTIEGEQGKQQQETELARSAKKVIIEICERFPNFKKLAFSLHLKYQNCLKEIIREGIQQKRISASSLMSQENNINSNSLPPLGEQIKVTQPKQTQPQPQTEVKQEDKLMFGFLKQEIYDQLTQSNKTPQEKMAAMEEILNALEIQSQSEKQNINIPEVFQFLQDSLKNSTQVTINVFILKAIKILLQRADVFPQINLNQMASSLLPKINDSNKLLRQEVNSIFSIILKEQGTSIYTNLLLTFLEKDKLGGQKITSQHKERLVHLLGTAIKQISNHSEIDSQKLVGVLSKLSKEDPKISNKVQEICVEAAKFINPTILIEHLQDNNMDSDVLEQIKEKVCPDALSDKLALEEADDEEIKAEDSQSQSTHRSDSNPNFRKAKQQQPKIIITKNGLLSPKKILYQKKESRSSNRSKASNEGSQKLDKIEDDQFYETEKIKVKQDSPLINPKSINYPSKEKIKNMIQKQRGSNPGSPNDGATMSSTSDRLKFIKSQREINNTSESIIKPSMQIPPVNLGNIKKNPSLINEALSLQIPSMKTSKSHQLLPLVSQIGGSRSGQSVKNNKVGMYNFDKSKELHQIPEFQVETFDKDEQKESPTRSIPKKRKLSKLKVGNNKLSLDPQMFQETISSMSLENSELLSSITKKSTNNTSSVNMLMNKMRETGMSVASIGKQSVNTNQDNKYQSSDELEPLVNPELEWKLCQSDIRSDNWSRQFEACNIFRRACKFHLKDTIIKSNKIDKQTLETFNEIISLIIKLVESLRSQVAKASMITLYDLFEILPKVLLEQNLEQIFTVLIKKSIDSNVFMADQAEKTMIRMCNSLSEIKLIPCLLSQKTNKSSVIRSQICRCLNVVIQKIKSSGSKGQKKKSNDLEKQIIGQIGQYITDQNQEVRNQAKISLKMILEIYDEQAIYTFVFQQALIQIGQQKGFRVNIYNVTQ